MDGHKTESQVTESTGEVGSPQCARKESGSRVSRPKCPSVCHHFTETEREREKEKERDNKKKRRREREGERDTKH